MPLFVFLPGGSNLVLGEIRLPLNPIPMLFPYLNEWALFNGVLFAFSGLVQPWPCKMITKDRIVAPRAYTTGLSCFEKTLS